MGSHQFSNIKISYIILRPNSYVGGNKAYNIILFFYAVQFKTNQSTPKNKLPTHDNKTYMSSGLTILQLSR